jgi:hypothetical protein
MTTEWIKKRGKVETPRSGYDPEQQSDDFYKDGKLKIVIIGKDGKPKIVGEDDQKQEFKSGGRAGFKVGGAAKRGISKILRKK